MALGSERGAVHLGPPSYGVTVISNLAADLFSWPRLLHISGGAQARQHLRRCVQ